jgi:ribosomal protein S27E
MKIISSDIPTKTKKVINIAEVRGLLRGTSCTHQNIIVDETLSTVECGDCSEKLNPVMILARIGKEESRYMQENKRLNETRKDLAMRLRCKCQHCGKITRIKV